MKPNYNVVSKDKILPSCDDKYLEKSSPLNWCQYVGQWFAENEPGKSRIFQYKEGKYQY